VEASSPAALSNGMNALAARLARGLNQLMGTRGKVFPDRYHAHVLRTPREVRSAIAYALENLASHACRRGEDVAARAGRFTSAGAARLATAPRPGSWPAWPAAATSPARTWLLRGIGPP
jgi:hypothetical protein